MKRVGKVALALAKFTYFCKSNLKSSTVSGREMGLNELDPNQLEALKRDAKAAFANISPTKFKLIWKGQGVPAIANFCRRLRLADKKSNYK